MRRDKYLLVCNTDDTQMWVVIQGIRGIANALYNHPEYDDCPENVMELFGGLKVLAETLETASGASGEDEAKVRKVLAAPDTRAEQMSKRLDRTGHRLLVDVVKDHYSVVDRHGDRLTMYIASLDEIEAWMAREDIEEKEPTLSLCEDPTAEIDPGLRH